MRSTSAKSSATLHGRLMRRSRTPRVIIPEGGGHRNRIGVHVHMALMRYPWTMRGLMPNQQAPWLIIILLVKPRQRTVGQHVGRISFDRHIAIRRMEQWVDVCALIVEHLPVIESSRIVNTAMPYAICRRTPLHTPNHVTTRRMWAAWHRLVCRAWSHH